MTLPGGVTQEQADAAFAAAVADTLRWPLPGLRVDWGRDGTFTHPLSTLAAPDPDARPGPFSLESLTVTREVAGDMPAEVGLVDGRVAAAMEAVLGPQRDPDTGEVDPFGNDPVRVFAPYDPDAPLYGTPLIGSGVEVDLGFDTTVGPQTRPRFTGTVSRVEPRPGHDERTVTLGGIDGADRLRALINQPPVGMDSLLLARYGPQRYAARINSQWLVDRILRANGVYASPPPQPGSFISATMHGSAFPEIGSGGMPEQVAANTPSAPQPWSNVDHPYGMLAPAPGSPADTGSWSADEALTMFPGDGFGCSFLLRAPTRAVSTFLMAINLAGGPLGTDPGSTAYQVEVDLIQGAPAMLLYTPADGPQGVFAGDWELPARPRWVHVGVHWAFGDGDCSMTMVIDGRTYALPPVSCGLGAPRMQPWSPTTTVFYELSAIVSNVCWFRSPLPPEKWVAASWVSQARIDPGLNEWAGIPQISGEESLSLLTEIAAAEAAQIGADVDGTIVFRSRAVHRPRGEPAAVTADRDLASLVVVTDEASVRNSISSAVTPLLVGDYEWVVDAGEVDQFECGPGATPFTVPLPADTAIVDPLYVGQFNEPGYLNAWDEVTDRPDFRAVWMFCAVYAAYPTIVVDPALIDVRLFPARDGEITFTVFNYSGFAVRFQTEDTLSDPDPDTGEVTVTPGKAAFRIPGRLLKAQATVPQNITDPGSVTQFGPRGFDLGGGSNRWHQHPAAIDGVAESILAATAYPTPVLDAVEVLCDPRRDLNDPVEILDPGGVGSVVGTITGITTSVSTGAPAMDQLTVRPIAPPGFGIYGRDGIGTTLRFGA